MTTESIHSENNVFQAEIEKFGALATRWWDAEGPQKPLHILNPVRLQYIQKYTELSGKKVVDIGCGGGLLSEAMAQAGADVTGIDLAPELIQVAKLHSLESGIKVNYQLQAAEVFAEKNPELFDIVVCMEMLEHVPNPLSIIESAVKLLKPNGHLFVSTLNRTFSAFALAIVGAEYIARLLPKGTHHYKQFIKPSELASWLRTAECNLNNITGIEYQPIRQQAKLTSKVDINYLAYATKVR